MNATTFISPPHSGQDKGSTSYTRLINIAQDWLHCLGGDGVYVESENSPTFPGLPIARLVQFLEPDPTLDYLSVIREFRQWVHETLGK